MNSREVFKKKEVFILAVLTTILVASPITFSNYVVEYRVVYIDGFEDKILVDLNKTTEIEIRSFKIPVQYINAVKIFSKNIVKKTTVTIAVEQLVSDNTKVLNKYSTNHILVEFHNTYYELYYDSKTGVLVYGFIKQNEIEVEIILRTSLSITNTHLPPVKTIVDNNYETTSTTSVSTSINNIDWCSVIYIVLTIVISTTLITIVKLHRVRKH